jgi:single-stranded-DNA-specific exonuclease
MEWVFPDQQNKSFLEYLYSTRNITNSELFFNPKEKDISSPFAIHDMDKAADAIINAVGNKKRIFIHGDFDVDGITATSIMWNFLYRDLGADVLPFIPNRFTDGYGLSEDTIQNIIDQGGNLIISVDCGVKDIELVNKYSDQIDFIITDHHTIRMKSEGLQVEGSKFVGDYLISSKAKAVVHPQIAHSQQPVAFSNFCGAAVSWKVCTAINEKLGNKTNIYKYLDLVALGTVCDVMPLVDENRTLVKLGLKQMSRTENMGLKSLCKTAKIDLSTLDAYHLGFIIGPRLNAAGRLESAMDAVRLLTTNNKSFAEELSNKLDMLNKERQDLTKKYLEIAEEKLQNEQSNKIHFIVGDEWPEGIIGLIAGRLTEKYNKPFLVGSNNGEIIKASARSPEYFHIADALRENSEHLERYGGHAQAAGLSLYSTNFDKFYSMLNEFAESMIVEADSLKKLKIDALVDKEDITSENAISLLSLAPFGNSNPKPLIALKNIKITNFKTMGADGLHIKILIPEYSFEIVGFNIANEILKLRGQSFDFAGHLDLNVWNGRTTPVFKMQHFRVASES